MIKKKINANYVKSISGKEQAKFSYAVYDQFILIVKQSVTLSTLSRTMSFLMSTVDSPLTSDWYLPVKNEGLNWTPYGTVNRYINNSMFILRQRSNTHELYNLYNYISYITYKKLLWRVYSPTLLLRFILFEIN